jgi:SulP family sulfate permease
VRRFETLRADTIAGLTLGIESVPDGLAGGLLASVNPVFGLNAYLVGTLAGALSTGSAFMAVQATGAMAMVIADLEPVHRAADGDRALFTLAILTGLLMIAAGVLRFGRLLRFVSNAVTVGFISAVGVNIVLGQLGGLTGYAPEGSNRLLRAIDLATHPQHWDPTSVVVGLGTVALILALGRTRLGALGLVAAVALTSAAAVIADWGSVATVRDIAPISAGLPLPALPEPRLVAELMVPAATLAFVGLIQGAAISASVPNSDGTFPNASRDFVGQGVANVASGILRGMPVGGSMSGTSIIRMAGARSRLALVLASMVMAVVILVFGEAVGQIALPALAGLLVTVGVRTIDPERMLAVSKVGPAQAVVLAGTFALTLLLPLPYAVMAGIGISMLLFVVQRSNAIRVRRWDLSEPDVIVEAEPPRAVPPGEVVVLQPYGSTFFAAAHQFEASLPAVAPSSRGSVVIIRLRGHDDIGSTFAGVLRRYAESLAAVGSKLVLVSASPEARRQLDVMGVIAVVSAQNVYAGDDRVGATVRRAYDDAVASIARTS